MNSKLTGKPKHLFVVKEDSPAHVGKMLSAESLTPDQQLTAKRYIGLSQSAGIVVGALVKNASWDVRPLLLENGQLSLLRFSDPAIALNKSKLSFLRASCDRLLANPESTGLITFGEIEGQVWIRRRYFQHTLADEEAAQQAVHPLQISQKLIRAVSALHAGNSIHGHICPQNVSLDRQEVFIFDHSFSVSSLPHVEEIGSLAPELRNAAVPTFACDVFGLALVMRSLPSFALGAEQEQCLERMLMPEPGLRPSLEAVKEIFMPREATVAKPAVLTHIIATTGVTAGKLVQRTPIADSRSSVPTAQPQGPRIITPQLPAVAPNLVPEWKRNDPIENAPTIPAQPQAPQSGLPFSWILVGILLLGGGVYAGKEYLGSRHIDLDSSGALQDAWFSNTPSRMVVVAQAAVDGDSRAQVFITADAMKGNSRPLVRGSLIRNAFNAQWEGQLSDSDREIILRLALARLLKGQSIQLPPLSQAHPAIAFAIAGDMPDLQSADGGRELSEVPLASLAALPQPYGVMFDQLEKTGVANLGVRAARGLSHILAGDASPESIAAYFSGIDSKDNARLRVAILFPLAQRVPKIQDLLYAGIESADGPLAPVVTWFSSEDMAQWSQAPHAAHLSLILGELPSQDLTFEQYVDLLTFPDLQVREKAKVRLGEKFFDKKAAAMLQFLASTGNHLNRFQVLTLLTALKMQGEASFALVGSLLDTKPSPLSILGLLLARAGYEKLDPINVELARYLTKTNVRLGIEDLQALSAHPEQLARAMAYARLDPSDPKQRQILENAAVVEPSERLRGQVKEKLKGVVIDVPDPTPAAEGDPELDAF